MTYQTKGPPTPVWKYWDAIKYADENPNSRVRNTAWPASRWIFIDSNGVVMVHMENGDILVYQNSPGYNLSENVAADVWEPVG